jgi:hypothetical protein
MIKENEIFTMHNVTDISFSNTFMYKVIGNLIYRYDNALLEDAFQKTS